MSLGLVNITTDNTYNPNDYNDPSAIISQLRFTFLSFPILPIPLSQSLTLFDFFGSFIVACCTYVCSAILMVVTLFIAHKHFNTVILIAHNPNG